VLSRRLAVAMLAATAVAAGSIHAAAVDLPHVPPLPPTPPVASDVIAVDATLSLVPMGGVLGVTGTFSMSGGCGGTVSAGDPLPEAYASPSVGPSPAGPVCTIGGSGAYSANDCVEAGFDGTGTLAGDDGQLTGMSYHIDAYGGLAIFSGTATESEIKNGVSETDPVVMYGAFAMAAVPSAAPGNNCLEGVATVTLAGQVTVVESTSSP
jgi:hypothetical protein